MKKFKDFIVSEEVDLTAGVESGKVNVDDHAVRNNINSFLNGELACNVVTPYVALNKINKVLANFHIFLPKAPYMEDNQGVHVFRIHQFGKVAGMRNDGSVVTKIENPYSLYFEWKRNERGMFNVFAEIVTDEELADLLDAVEEDTDEDQLDEEEYKKPALKNIYLDAYMKKKQKGKKKLSEETEDLNPLATARSKSASGLSNADRMHMYALTMAEVGRDNPKAHRALIETIYNRHHAQGTKSLRDTMGANYYEPLRTHTRGYQNYQKALKDLQSNPELFKQMDAQHNEVLKGSNDSNYATHNGSAGVAAGARRTQTIAASHAGETFSRKDNPAYANLHGAGTVKKEGNWYKTMSQQMTAWNDSKKSGTQFAKTNAKTSPVAPTTSSVAPSTQVKVPQKSEPTLPFKIAQAEPKAEPKKDVMGPPKPPSTSTISQLLPSRSSSSTSSLSGTQTQAPKSVQSEPKKTQVASLSEIKIAAINILKEALEDASAKEDVPEKLTPGSFKQQSPAVMRRLMKDFGIEKHHAAGIMGNLGHESAGLVAGIQEKGHRSGSGGLGWAQWTGPRRRQFEQWSKDNGLDTKDPEANYGFLKHELQTSHKSSIDALRKAKTPEEAMYSFENTFERAGIKSYGSRLNFTKQALQAHGEDEIARANAPKVAKIEKPKEPETETQFKAPSVTSSTSEKPESSGEINNVGKVAQELSKQTKIYRSEKDNPSIEDNSSNDDDTPNLMKYSQKDVQKNYEKPEIPRNDLFSQLNKKTEKPTVPIKPNQMQTSTYTEQYISKKKSLIEETSEEKITPFHFGDSQAAGQVGNNGGSQRQFVYMKNGATRVGASPQAIDNEIRSYLSRPGAVDQLKKSGVVLSPGADNADDRLDVHSKSYQSMAKALRDNGINYKIIPPGGKRAQSHMDALRSAFGGENIVDTSKVRRAGDNLHYNTQELRNAIGSHIVKKPEEVKPEVKPETKPELKMPEPVELKVPTTNSFNTSKCPPGSKCGGEILQQKPPSVPDQVAQAITKLSPQKPKEPEKLTQSIEQPKSDNTKEYDYGKSGKTTETGSYKLFQSPEVAKLNKKPAETFVVEQKFLTEQEDEEKRGFNVIDVTGQSKLPSRGDMKSVKGLVIHHSAGRGDINGLIATAHQRGYWAQYGMNRDGTVFRYAPGKAWHTRNSYGDKSPPGVGNDNMEGIEVIAKNEDDITPEQRESLKRFAVHHQRQYNYDPKTGFYGHSELNPGHRHNEGESSARDFRNNWDTYSKYYDDYYKKTQVAQKDSMPNIDVSKTATSIPDQELKTSTVPTKVAQTLDKQKLSSAPPVSQQKQQTSTDQQTISSIVQQKLPVAPVTGTTTQTKLSTEPVSANKLDLTDPQKLEPKRYEPPQIQQTTVKQPERAPTPQDTKYTYRGGETSTENQSAKTFRSPEVARLVKEAKELVKKKYELKTSNAKVLQKALAAAKTEIVQLNRKLKKCEPMDEQHSGFLSHMPRDYVNKFSGVKEDPQKKTQYNRERWRKKETNDEFHSHKYITGKKEESKKPRG